MLTYLIYTNNASGPGTDITITRYNYLTLTAEYELRFRTPTLATPTEPEDLFSFLIKAPTPTPYIPLPTSTPTPTPTPTSQPAPTATIPVISLEIEVANIHWFVAEDTVENPTDPYGASNPEYVDYITFDMISDQMTTAVDVWIRFDMVGGTSSDWWDCDFTTTTSPVFSLYCFVANVGLDGTHNHRIVEDIITLHIVADPSWTVP